MCKSISEDSNACVDRRSQLFLNLCHYQGTEKTNNTDAVKSADQGEQGGRKGNNNDYFIKRNIEVSRMSVLYCVDLKSFNVTNFI